MEILERVEIAVVQAHERSVGANIRLGGYGMPPADEFTALRVRLQPDDLQTLLLPNDYATHTEDTCRLADLLDSAVEDAGVASFMQFNEAREKELVILSNGVDGPLLVIDGNHRLCAKFLSHGDVADTAAYLCIHADICRWGVKRNFSCALPE